MKGRGLYVGISGIDGAGKSTVAFRLANWMNKSGLPCYVAEAKEDFVKQLSRAACQGENPRSFFGAFAYDFAKSFDIARDYFLKVEPLLAAGTSVIMPRTVECRLSVARALGTENVERIENLLSVVPRPPLVFRLRLAPKLACERVMIRGIDEESVEGLSRLSEAMDLYSDQQGWIEIDSSGQPDEVFDSCLSVLRSHLEMTAVDKSLRGPSDHHGALKS